jgi:hypothetical protein
MMSVASQSIDRPARERLAAAMRGFLDGELRAFAFDDAIFAIRDDSDDVTVQSVALRLWSHYDDFEDHAAALTREEWDYFQRLLLILESDAHLIETRRRVWSPIQCVAAFGAAATAACVWGVVAEQGWGVAVLAGFFPGYLISVGVFIANRERASQRLAASSADLAPYGRIEPFGSVSELADVHRATPRFRKRRFPPEVGERRIRERSSEAFLLVQWAIGTFLWTPVVLLCQSLPTTDEETHVLPTAGLPARAS